MPAAQERARSCGEGGGCLEVKALKAGCCYLLIADCCRPLSNAQEGQLALPALRALNNDAWARPVHFHARSRTAGASQDNLDPVLSAANSIQAPQAQRANGASRTAVGRCSLPSGQRRVGSQALCGKPQAAQRCEA